MLAVRLPVYSSLTAGGRVVACSASQGRSHLKSCNMVHFSHFVPLGFFHKISRSMIAHNLVKIEAWCHWETPEMRWWWAQHNEIEWLSRLSAAFFGSCRFIMRAFAWSTDLESSIRGHVDWLLFWATSCQPFSVTCLPREIALCKCSDEPAKQMD